MFLYLASKNCRNLIFSTRTVPLRHFSLRTRVSSLIVKCRPHNVIRQQNVKFASSAIIAVGTSVIIGSHFVKNYHGRVVQCDAEVPISTNIKDPEEWELKLLKEEEKKKLASGISGQGGDKSSSFGEKRFEDVNGETCNESQKSRVHHEYTDEDDSYTGSKHIIQPQIKGFDWLQLGELLAPHWHWLTIAVGSALVVSVVNIEIPRLLGQVIDVVSQRLIAGGGQTSNLEATLLEFNQSLKEPAIKIITYYCIQSAATFTYIYSLGVVGERVAAELRRRLFSSIIYQDIVFFDTHMTGEVINVMTSDVQEFKSSFKLVVSQGLRAISQTMGCMVSLYLVSPQMTQTVLIIVPSVIFVGSSIGSVLRKISRKAQSQLAKATIVGEEAIGNIRTVRAFSMEEQELEMYTQELEKAREMNERLGVGIGIFQGGSNLFLNSVVLGIIYSGGRLMAQNVISGGDLMSFMVAAQTIQKSLTQLSLLFGQFVRGLEAGSRVFEYINMGKDLSAEGTYRFNLKDFKGDIKFRNVNFNYPTRKDQAILKNFNLTLHSGEVVALVGSSGCGKSTISALIERFYLPDSGEITIDGVPLADIDGSWLRGEIIGLINQEPILFATSVMENIRYGKPSATDEEVYESAKKANAYQFIKDFPNGFHTIVGERGVTVSGGQKQRIAIARALLKNPRIVILDEATSALDTASEKIVQDTLDSVVHGRTVLIIAHRLSTIKNANKIAVINNGSVAEIGTHNELTERKGLYYNLIKQQEFAKSHNT